MFNHHDKAMKTNVLIHEGVALKMDSVEKPTHHSNGEYDSIEVHAYELAKEKAIKERIEYENQDMVIDLILDYQLKSKYQLWMVEDGAYVVDLPETETVHQYYTKLNGWKDAMDSMEAEQYKRYRRVARFKKEPTSFEVKEALPCPFCGETPHWANEAMSDSHYYIRCITCQVIIKADRRDKVIGLWNTRFKKENERTFKDALEFQEDLEKKESKNGYSIEYDESQYEDKYFWRIYSPKVNGNGTITMTCIAKTFEENDAIRIVELLNKLIEGQDELNKFAKGKPLQFVDSDAAKLEALADWFDVFDVFDADYGRGGLANNEVQIDLRRIAQKLRTGQIEMIKLLRWFEIEKQNNRILYTEGYDEIVERFIHRNTPKP